MKNIYYVSLLLVLCIWTGCSKKGEDSVNPQVTEPLPTEPPTGKLSWLKGSGYDPPIRTGEVFEITGENFAKNPTDNIIKVNGVQVSHVEVIDLSTSSSGKITRKLRSCVPKDATSGEVTLTIGKKTLELGMLSIKGYKSGNQWNQIADFPGTLKTQWGASILSLNGKAYIGLGNYYNFTTQEKYFSDFWEYDPGQNKWTKKVDFPGGNRLKAVCLSIGNKGYVGLGGTDANSAGITQEKDFWEYDPATDKWTKKADFPGGRRDISFYFSVGNRGYVGYINRDSGQEVNDFWEYNPTDDSWQKRASFPNKIIFDNNAPPLNNISTTTKGYLCINRDEFWEYDPGQNKWTPLFRWTGADGINYTFGFSMNNRIYMGLSQWTVPGFSADLSYTFFEYDPGTDQAKKLPEFAGAPRSNISAFSIGNVGYAGLGFYFKDVWAFRP